VVGELYDVCQAVLREIDTRGLDVFRTRGAVNLQVGFLITLVHEDDPDDLQRIAAVRQAAKDILDLTL
jgi:hypothetical protein